MKYMTRDKIVYAYHEVGSGSPAFVFVHGWACDHSFLSPQIDYFSRCRRVIAPDLPGHGASDAPLQKYTVTQFADDIAWLCGEHMAGLDQFRRSCPQLETAQTMVSGHFAQLEVPEQINSMLERFVTVSVLKAHACSASVSI